MDKQKKIAALAKMLEGLCALHIPNAFWQWDLEEGYRDEDGGRTLIPGEFEVSLWAIYIGSEQMSLVEKALRTTTGNGKILRWVCGCHPNSIPILLRFQKRTANENTNLVSLTLTVQWRD